MQIATGCFHKHYNLVILLEQIKMPIHEKKLQVDHGVHAPMDRHLCNFGCVNLLPPLCPAFQVRLRALAELHWRETVLGGSAHKHHASKAVV